MRVIVTGSREVGADPNVARRIIEDRLYRLAVEASPKNVTIVHGAARGVDRIACQEAEKAGLLVEAHPANWETHGKAAGFIRNEHMAELGADLCIAFWDGRSNGTRDMITRAEGYGIPVEVVSL